MRTVMVIRTSINTDREAIVTHLQPSYEKTAYTYKYRCFVNTMEEPHFVNYESAVQSNAEEFPKFEFCASNFVEVKVEPDDVPEDSSVKEETGSQDVNEEDAFADQIISQQHGKHIQPPLSASQSTQPEETRAYSTDEGDQTTIIRTESASVGEAEQLMLFHFKSCGDEDDETSELFSCNRCGTTYTGDHCLCLQEEEDMEEYSHSNMTYDAAVSKCLSVNHDVLEDSEEHVHVCKVCGEGFVEQSALQTHKLKHTANRSFDCTFCGKVYSRKFDLQRHILSHTGEKRYECTLCSKAYSRKALLQTHILTHTGEKPHICTYCNKAFTQLGHLQTHVLTHTGHKPHTCSTCGKGFCRRSALKMHVLTHTKTKAFCCTLCGKAFSVRFSLRRHMSMHTGS
ncbi:zinc finger protein OZF isoform X2 [Anabrus simplex]|uniref:zinc finger protein OZF isoform X2 n=1 Tax=Anabrus simplex TaxID=316456 RepID=UPI0035A37523